MIYSQNLFTTKLAHQIYGSILTKSVCYGVKKKEQLETLAKQKSAVKICEFNVSGTYGGNDAVMGRRTVNYSGQL